MLLGENVRLTFYTLGFLLLFLVIPVLLLVLREHLRQRHHGKKLKQFYADREKWRARLLHPKREEVERHLQGKLPDRLSRLYDDKDLVLQTDFQIRSPTERMRINEFFPLDADILSELRGGKIFKQGFPFAGDIWGDCYFVPTSPVQSEDAPVFRYCHNGGKVEPIAESITQFLAWKHEPRFSARKLRRRTRLGIRKT